MKIYSYILFTRYFNGSGLRNPKCFKTLKHITLNVLNPKNTDCLTQKVFNLKKFLATNFFQSIKIFFELKIFVELIFLFWVKVFFEIIQIFLSENFLELNILTIKNFFWVKFFMVRKFVRITKLNLSYLILRLELSLRGFGLFVFALFCNCSYFFHVSRMSQLTWSAISRCSEAERLAPETTLSPTSGPISHAEFKIVVI